MGFSEGTEDEFLLTCFVCKEPFGMLAAFCGGCGARRDQAMGIERAKASQQISQNEILTPSFTESFPTQSGTAFENPFFPGAQATPAPSNTGTAPAAATTTQSNMGFSAESMGLGAAKAPKAPKKRKTSIRRQIFFSNIRLRLEAINNWQSRHARLLNSLGMVLFLGGTYVFVQSFIVGTSHPELVAEKYLKAGVVRDAEYFDINDEVDAGKSHPIFPVKYAKGIESTEWFHSSDIHGFSGTAEVSVIPAGEQFDQTPIVLKMKAKYEKTLGIFRKPIWVPAEPTATVEISYPSSGNTLIYINGYMAGTTDSPAVKEGTYFAYPGRIEVKFYRNGKETSDSYEFFIQTSGSY